MLNTIAQNSVLTQWIKRLDNTRLPVNELHRREVLRAIQNPNLSLREIAQVITQAPSIALIILREANRHLNSLSEPLQTLESALARLGLERCEVLIRSLKGEQEAQIPLALRQVWLLGQHMNTQAVNLFGQRMARLWQEIHWGSLLFLSPVWPLLTREPQLFSEWERRVLGNNEPAQKVERELIGIPLITLCSALAEHWKLPSWIIDGYHLLNNDPQQLVRALHIARHSEQPLQQQQQLDQRPALQNWLNRPANTLVFSCGLVMAAHNSWGSEQCLRWQRLISLYLQQPLAEIQQATHQHTIELARLAQTSELWLPAQALLWPWQTQRLRQATLNSQVSAPSSNDLAQWRIHCSKLLSSPSPFSNSVQITQCASQALQACGMRRICFMLLNRQAQQIQVSQLSGIRPEQIALNFSLSSNPLMTHLLKQSTQLLITDKTAESLRQHIPEPLLNLFADNHWALASVANERRVLMLIACDQDTSDLNPQSILALKKTLECIGRALVLYSANKG